MTRFLIYLFPAIADLIVAATMFVCSIRLADAGRSRTEVAMVFATWAAVYIASNLILSRFVTSRNAAAMLIVANLLFTATAGTFVLIEGIWAIYAIMAVLAVATALFFLPFQVFMKAVEPDQHRGVLRSAAIYTFSWSLGFASGPFIAGFIYQGLGWQWCFAFTGLLSLLTACGVQLLKHYAKYHYSEVGVLVNYHAMPDLAWLGWGVAGVGCLGLFSFLALLPSVGVDFAIPKSQIGSIIASLYVVQALVGLSFLHSRTWMFRPRPVMGFAAFGVIGLTGFGVSLLPVIDGIEVLNVSLQTLGLYASVVCYGVFSGSFFFGLVFYSLVHPHRSAIYVAVNETVVGICGVVGPVMAGVLADRFGFAAFPVILIGMIVGVAMLQFIVLKRLAGKLAEQQPEIVRW
ncbi:MAG: MFS transporter [Planctomycetota bacterium]|jgi:DHA1 family quinolone resistance protein-like MFS transporter